MPQRLIIEAGPAHSPTALYSANGLSSLVAVLCNGGRVRCTRDHCVTVRRNESFGLLLGTSLVHLLGNHPLGHAVQGREGSFKKKVKQKVPFRSGFCTVSVSSAPTHPTEAAMKAG